MKAGEVTREYYREQGRAEEQARIIKLLESDPEELIASGGGLRAGYETAIALIKGESQKNNEAVVLLTEGDK